jgi:hypothetical protein
MTIHSLLRHVGLDVPEVIHVNGKEIREMTDRFQGIANDFPELIAFMQGPDRVTFARLISFFSVDSRYCHPRELKPFWESLTEAEKFYYRTCNEIARM